MKKKDYENIARCFRATLKHYPRSNDVLGIMATYMAYNFQIDNYKFDKKKFIEACGVEVH